MVLLYCWILCFEILKRQVNICCVKNKKEYYNRKTVVYIYIYICILHNLSTERLGRIKLRSAGKNSGSWSHCMKVFRSTLVLRLKASNLGKASATQRGDARFERRFSGKVPSL